MKKLFFTLSIIIGYSTVSHSLYAMRTGMTRKESRQAHYIALKKARVASKAISARDHQYTTQSQAIRDPYAIYVDAPSTASKFKWPAPTGQHAARCFYGSGHAYSLMSYLLLTLILMQSAQVAYADDRQVKKVDEAVASSGTTLFLGPGGMAAIKGMTSLMEKTSQFVVARCEGALDGKLGAGADNFGRLLHTYTEYEKTDPVKARLSLSGLTVLAKGVAGGVAGGIEGGLATAPVGGEGAIAGAIGGTLFGLSKGLTQEALGIVGGEVAHKLTGNAIPEFVRKGIEKFAPKLRYFDRTLTDEQTIHYSILLGCAALSSTEMTPIIKELGHINWASFTSVLKNIPQESVESGLKDFELAIRDTLKHPYEGTIKHSFFHEVHGEMHESFEHNSLDKETTGEFYRQTWQEAQPFKEVLKQAHMPYEAKSYDFMGDAQKLIQHEQFKQWKAESTNLYISRPQRLDFVNQYLQHETARPLCEEAVYNKQQARKYAKW